jgi:hypothetical protein
MPQFGDVERQEVGKSVAQAWKYSTVKPIRYIHSPVADVGGFMVGNALAIAISSIVYWTFESYFLVLIVFVSVFFMGALNHYNYRQEVKLVSLALSGESLRCLLSDDVYDSSPVWRIDYPNIKKSVYLDWMVRTGLRKGISEPRVVSWFLGDPKPIGKNLVHNYLVNVFPVKDTNVFVVEGDEAYFVCKKL